MVVLTFSGPAVADAQPLALAAAAVGRQAGPRVVVVPALAGIPERVGQMVQFAREGRTQAARALAARILERHRDLARRAAAGSADRVIESIDECHAGLDELMRRAASPDAIDAPRQATGTRLSSLVVAAALREAGIDARALEADALDGGEVAAMLEQGAVPVIAAQATAMLSAAQVAAALDARELQVWTDSDGVPAADLSIVPSAHAVARLSFAEALELARWGVTALDARGLELAGARELPIVVRSTRHPDRPGTIIDGRPSGDAAAPAALAWRRGAAALRFSSPDMRAPVFTRRLLDLCSQAGEPPFAAAIAGPSVVVAFDDRACADRAAAAAREFAQVAPLDDVALLSAVGESLASEPRVAAGVLEAVQNVTVHASALHPSGRSLTMLVDDADAGEAMRRVYARFFAGGSES